MSSWRLGRRFTLLFSVAAVAVLLLGIVTVLSLVSLHRAEDRVTRTLFNTLSTSSSLFSGYLDQETGVRGYLLTAEPSFLDPYTTGRATQVAAEADLPGQVEGEPGLTRLLNALESAGHAWSDGYALPAIAAVRASGAAAAADTAQELHGKALFDQVRVAYAAYRAELLNDRADAVAQIERARTVLVVVIVLLALLVLGLLGAVAWALRQWILQPLDRLGADARTVAGGALEQEIARQGPPDVEELTVDVESMRMRILDELETVVRSRDTIEEQRLMLEDQSVELRRSNSELEQFAYVASHDLQEPLRKISSFSELLQERYRGQLDERADQYLDFTADGARRMQQLIVDLLAFSRVGRGHIDRAVVPFDQLVDQAVVNSAAQLEQVGATVVHGGLPDVECSPTLMVQVVQNLISNAVKFRRGDTPLEMSLTLDVPGAGESPADESFWSFRFRDNGIGVAPEYADRIFVIFQRLHRKEDIPGTGIGLALCRKIVEFHGGRIWLEPSLGSGSTFVFTLPRNPDPEGAA